MRRPRAGAAIPEGAASTPSASTSAPRLRSTRWSSRCSSSGGLSGLVNNAAGNFIAPTESLSARAFDAIANIVFHGSFYVTQAVGKRWVAQAKAGTVAGGPAVPQRDEHHHHLGRQRQPLRRAVGDEQGRHRGDDQVAGGRVGASYGIRLNAVGPGEIPTEGMSKRLNPGEEPGARSKERNPMARPGSFAELQNIADVSDGAGPMRLAHRPEHHDGRRQRAGQRRQLLRAAPVERCAMAAKRASASRRRTRRTEPLADDSACAAVKAHIAQRCDAGTKKSRSVA